MIATQNTEKLNFIHKIDISKNYLNICTDIRTKRRAKFNAVKRQLFDY